MIIIKCILISYFIAFTLCDCDIGYNEIYYNSSFKTLGDASENILIKLINSVGCLYVDGKFPLSNDFYVTYDLTQTNLGEYPKDGMTITLSRNYACNLNAREGGLGINLTTETIFGELDLYKNTNDISRTSISVHSCLEGTCSVDENSNTVQTAVSELNIINNNLLNFTMKLKYKSNTIQIQYLTFSAVKTFDNFLTYFKDGYYIGLTAAKLGGSIITVNSISYCYKIINNIIFTSTKGSYEIFINNVIVASGIINDLSTNSYTFSSNIINSEISIKIKKDSSVLLPKFIATIYYIDGNISKFTNTNNTWFDKFDKVKVVSNEVVTNIPGINSKAKWIWGNQNSSEVYLTTMVPFPFEDMIFCDS